MGLEAEKFQDLQLESWRPRRADGIAPVWFQRPENQESQWCKFQTESKSKGRRPIAQLKDSLAERILPYSAFCSIQAVNGLDEAYPHWGGQSAFFEFF